MPKPRKKWEPEYRFGGGPGRFFVPPPLGTVNAYSLPKTKKSKKK